MIAARQSLPGGACRGQARQRSAAQRRGGRVHGSASPSLAPSTSSRIITLGWLLRSDRRPLRLPATAWRRVLHSMAQVPGGEMMSTVEITHARTVGGRGEVGRARRRATVPVPTTSAPDPAISRRAGLLLASSAADPRHHAVLPSLAHDRPAKPPLTPATAARQMSRISGRDVVTTRHLH